MNCDKTNNLLPHCYQLLNIERRIKNKEINNEQANEIIKHTNECLEMELMLFKCFSQQCIDLGHNPCGRSHPDIFFLNPFEEKVLNS